VRLNLSEVAQQAREEPEKRFLLEVRSEFLMRVGEDEDDNREDLGHVVHLGLVVVSAGRVGVVLDHEGDEAGEGVDGLEDPRSGSTASGLVLDVRVDRDLGANAEEETRDLFALENTLLLKLNDEIDERFFDVERLLVEANPFGEAEGELLADTGLVGAAELRRREVADVDGSASLDVLKELTSGVGGLVLTLSLVERLEDVRELLPRCDGRNLSEAGRGELRGEVDDGGAEVANDKLGELKVKVGDGDEAGLEQRNGDVDVELALVFGVYEPGGDLLRDLGRDGAEAVEEEDECVASEGGFAAVEELDDLLRAGEGGLVPCGRRGGHERNLLNDATKFRILRNAGESGRFLSGESLVELGNESGELLHRLRTGEDGGFGGLRDVSRREGGRVIDDAVATFDGSDRAETGEVFVDLELGGGETAELETKRVGKHAAVVARRHRSGVPEGFARALRMQRSVSQKEEERKERKKRTSR
jgi:hypothetical protein